MKKIKLITTITVVGVAFTAGVTTGNSAQPVITYLDSPPIETIKEVIVEKEKEIKVDSSLVLEQLEQLWELTTVKYNYSGACSFESSKLFKEWKLPFTTKNFVFTYDGYIKAGFDLSDIDITIEEDIVLVTLKEPILFDNVIREDTIRVIDESDNILNSIKIADITSILTAEKNKMQTRAINNGLLEQAKANAELIIKSVVSQIQIKCEIAYK